MTHELIIKFDNHGDIVSVKLNDENVEDRVKLVTLLDLYSIIEGLKVKDQDKLPAWVA